MRSPSVRRVRWLDSHSGFVTVAAVSRPTAWCRGLALGAAWLGGCGPVEYLAQVERRAPAALAEARQQGAEQLAPYEVTAAEEYLREAQVAATRSAYQRAIAYGRRAEELAVTAEGIARAHNLRAGAGGPPATPAPAAVAPRP
jgi:hypothetical protein